MNRRLPLLAVIPLLIISLAGCSSNPVTVVKVDPKDQKPTLSAEPSPSASSSDITETPSPTPTEADTSSQRITCDGKDATIVATKANVKGTSGADIIVIRSLRDVVVDAGAGNDAICVFTGTSENPKSVTVFGGDGNDRFYGSDGADAFFGGNGNDEASTYGGDDILTGGVGTDKLRAGAGNDYIRGGDGNDVIYAAEGDDVLAGDAGTDSLYGELGIDNIYTDKADVNQTDLSAEDPKTPTQTLAQYEASRVQTFIASATANGLTVSQGSGAFSGLVIAKNASGVIMSAFPGKK